MPDFLNFVQGRHLIAPLTRKRKPTPPNTMKHPHSPSGGRLAIGLLACLCSLQSVSAEEAIPTGKLDIDRTLVRVGSFSQLDWQIHYKTGITEILEVVPPNILRPKENLAMRVRVLGASFQQAKDNNGGGNNSDGVDSSNPAHGFGVSRDEIDNFTSDDEIRRKNAYDLPVEVMWSKKNSSWARILYATQSKINPSDVVLDTTVKAGDIINFRGRGYFNKDWLPFYSTAASTPNVLMLRNGDSIPTTNQAFQQSLIEDFLKPYLAMDGKTVKIGNREIIILMELGQTDPAHYGFDLQDLAVLVTFE
jgi:hypothetical protein